MAYKHKDGKCAKNTKEILENVLTEACSEYDLTLCRATVLVENPMKKVIKDEATTNVLPNKAEHLLEEAGTKDSSVREEFVPEVKGIDEYMPNDIISPEGTAKTKDVLLKVSKKRNYIQFRGDHTKN
jgi:hypothetical protein